MSDIASALLKATGALPDAERREGQLRMAEAVAEAIEKRRHLIVAAGTGTGKSLGYLVPALESGARVVIATATKALQDQLAKRDLPMLAESQGQQFTFAVLKGRSNYFCKQRAAEIDAGADTQMELPARAAESGIGARAAESGMGARAAESGTGSAPAGALGREVTRLLAWAEDAEVGDRAELSFEPSDRAWSQVSVGRSECPGATRCPAGEVCFAEAARKRASEADVVVVNTHLYCAHLLSEGEVLPPHDVTIIDEAHELEDIASATLGFEITAGRIRAVTRLGRPLAADQSTVREAEDGADGLERALLAWRGQRLVRPLPDAVAEAMGAARERVNGLLASVRRSEVDPGRRARTLEAGGHLVSDLDSALALGDDQVAWVTPAIDQPRTGGPPLNRALASGSTGDRPPTLNVAPLDVGSRLRELWWSRDEPPTAVLTSATIPPRLAVRLGLPAGSFDEIDVGSPFDYPNNGLLYCARHLPDPRSPTYESAMHQELSALIRAAQGRTLALFTSWRAMRAAVESVGADLPWKVYSQADLPKPALIDRFREDEHSCLFATMGFWQGVDVPGPALSMVVLDRIPFARPDDPLLQARRDKLGRAAFAVMDIPRAATLLAQGAGRLIRNTTDRGVVAVLDPRLSTARYGWELVRALPPMARTRHMADVDAFLAPLRREGTLQ